VLTVKHLSYDGGRGLKAVKTSTINCQVLYCAWELTTHFGWARLMLDRRGLVQALNVPWNQRRKPTANTPRARNDHGEETAYDTSCYVSPGPGP